MKEVVMAVLLGLVFGAGGGCLWAYYTHLLGMPRWGAVCGVLIYNFGLVYLVAFWSHNREVTMNHYMSFASMIFFEAASIVMLWLANRRSAQKGGAAS